MADVSLPLARERAEPARVEARERFLNAPRTAGILAFVLFAMTFDTVLIQDDGLVYFNFLRKLFGEQADAVAYQFGSAFWTAPFYLVSRVVASRGEFGSYHAAEVATTVASNAAAIVTFYFGWRILRSLDLPRGPAVLLLTLFGTTLFYVAALSPLDKHAADTLYATAAFWFALRSFAPQARRLDLAAVGGCLGLLLATRWANVALAFGIVVVFAALRRWREVAWIVATGAAASALLLGLPIVRHIPYAAPPGNVVAVRASADAPVVLEREAHRVALGKIPIIDPVLRGTRFDPTVPFKMLFTLHRGLFVWTPLTIFGTAGYLLLVRRERRHRAFLAALGVSALSLLAIHSLWGKQWDGGGGFAERFLTALFPFFLVGTAEFVRRFRAAGVALLALCAAWTLWLGLVHYNGYYHESSADSVVQIVENYTGPYRQPPPHDSIGNFGHEIGQRISDRWRLYWRLVS